MSKQNAEILADFIQFNTPTLNEMKNASPEIASAVTNVIAAAAQKFGGIPPMQKKEPSKSIPPIEKYLRDCFIVDYFAAKRQWEDKITVSVVAGAEVRKARSTVGMSGWTYANNKSVMDFNTEVSVDEVSNFYDKKTCEIAGLDGMSGNVETYFALPFEEIVKNLPSLVGKVFYGDGTWYDLTEIEPVIVDGNFTGVELKGKVTNIGESYNRGLTWGRFAEFLVGNTVTNIQGSELYLRDTATGLD
jgi:hypothetical protein